MIPGLDDFKGLWRLTREVLPANGVLARFTGEARFKPGPSGLIYTELGRLQIDGQMPMRAERKYIWRAGVQGGIDVFFDDGRPFHQIGPDTLEARHRCAPDVYDVRYDFDDWPNWFSEWQVTGPRKRYVMKSRYSRVADDFRQVRDSLP